MPQDPSVLIIPGGAQFLTVPDALPGNSTFSRAPTQESIFGQPVEVDFTGKPILAAPNRAGNAVTFAAIGVFAFPSPVPGIARNPAPPYDLMPSSLAALALNQVLLTGLYNVSQDDVFNPNPAATENSTLILNGTQLNQFAPLPNVPNSGFYKIILFIDKNTIIAEKVFPIPPNAIAIQPPPAPPDLANGKVGWSIFRDNINFESVQFAEGDPLTYFAKLAAPFNIVSPASGPARFANYDPTVQPVVVNDESGLFGKVQRA